MALPGDDDRDRRGAPGHRSSPGSATRAAARRPTRSCCGPRRSSCRRLIGAIGWGTEFAHFNAYMPAFLHGAIAAGAAVPAVYACWRSAFARHASPHAVASGATLGLALALAATCWTARWEPARFVPTAADVAAGDRLIARIHAIDGDVWMPSHPWYLHLAGKPPYVHRMGVKDVTTRQTRTVRGLDDAIKAHAFAALVLDDRDLQNELPILRSHRPALKLPADERPRLYTGAKIVPDSIWLPGGPRDATGGRARDLRLRGRHLGRVEAIRTAWGNGPTQAALPARGSSSAPAASGSPPACTTATPPPADKTRLPFQLDATRLTVRLGGGTDATRLRVELWVGNTIIATASVPEPGGDTLHEVALVIPPEQRGREGRLVLVDDSLTGHLDVDDVWAWQTP